MEVFPLWFFAAFWIISAPITYGIVLASYVRRYPSIPHGIGDISMALFMAILGPVGFLMSYEFNSAESIYDLGWCGSTKEK